MAIRSLEKLVRLIDEEMQDIGAQKIAMPTVILGSLWKQTGLLVWGFIKGGGGVYFNKHATGLI